ncbi:ATP-dependent zinc metalloprotease FtsH [Nevskia soli]|uniref:ATP-dependent zinc metalloprotease FtsH n=1 Tax=Nevskia soli TaxID=418856 RepID=UPI00056D5012|nr:ATP-dependent zinc metalloprotease FtsH [Nevskia soli]
MRRETHFTIWYAVAAILVLLFIQDFLASQSHVKTISYSEFQQALAKGEIKDVEVAPTSMAGSYKSPAAGTPSHFLTQRVDPQVAEQLSKAGVDFSGAPDPSLFEAILRWLLPTVGFFLLWMFLMPRMMGGQTGQLMAIGKSKAKVYVETDTKVSFADVAGVDEAKAELQEVVNFLKEPQRYGRLGARLPKGVLLVGPPGTGKTLLARAVAGEAGVPFLSINGSEFVEMFVGVGAARVRDLFEEARQKAPAIIFIDELDALGRARGLNPIAGGNDEKEQTLNQLLSEMDGFDPRQGLILLAATNRPEILDPALLRAGRFDRQVLVDRPDRVGRLQILQVHAHKIQLAPDLQLEQVAALTPGFSGADLANLVNEAALLATRRGAESVTLNDFTQAVERIVAGLEKKNRLLNPDERRVVAYHELGHAFVALSLKGTDAVHKVSIIPRGIGALGYTIQRPTEDRFLMNTEELENRMAVLLGGRAAEHGIIGQISTGAADDLAKATDIARSMVTRFGMVAELGQVAYEHESKSFLNAPVPFGAERSYSEGTAQKIDNAIRGLVDRAFEKSLAIIHAKHAALDKAAMRLLEKETLLEAEIKELAGTEPPLAGS